ncbi:hypothetical protein [Sedimentitalea nanhaiensis]|nr:hypothetical protein [Sedimentitalea nanhaiensis]
MSGDADVPEQRPTKARRAGKVTVRLGQEARRELEREARGQGVAVST